MAASAGSTRHRRAGPVEVGDHHRERLVLAVLAGPQRGHRRLAGRVGGQVVAAEALDGHHRPVPEPGRGPGERVAVRGPPVAVQQGQRRPAGRAAHRLGVEAPVGRVVVLAGAVGAHGEAGHGGGRPVVGDVA